jgi:hypothetical protein
MIALTRSASPDRDGTAAMDRGDQVLRVTRLRRATYRRDLARAAAENREYAVRLLVLLELIFNLLPNFPAPAGCSGWPFLRSSLTDDRIVLSKPTLVAGTMAEWAASPEGSNSLVEGLLDEWIALHPDRRLDRRKAAEDIARQINAWLRAHPPNT